MQVETEVFRLVDMNINPCRACAYCKSNGGKCVVNDDMQILYDRLKDSDAFIFGSPVYMGSMSAQTKLFVDRLYAITSSLVNWQDFWEKFGKKYMSLIFTQGNPDENRFKGFFSDTAKAIDYLGFSIKDILITCGNPERAKLKIERTCLKRLER